MSKIAVIAKLTARSGRRDELVAALAPLSEAVEGEEGTQIYAVHLDAGDADVVWFYELYTDQDALAAHSGSEAMKAAGGALGELLAGAPEITLLSPVRAKGIAF